MEQHRPRGCRVGPGLLKGRSGSCGAGWCHPPAASPEEEPDLPSCSRSWANRDEGRCAQIQEDHRVVVGSNLRATAAPGQGASEGRGGHLCQRGVSQQPSLLPPKPRSQNWFFCLLAPTVPARRAGEPKCKPVPWNTGMTKCLQRTGKGRGTSQKALQEAAGGSY